MREGEEGAGGVLVLPSVMVLVLLYLSCVLQKTHALRLARIFDPGLLFLPGTAIFGLVKKKKKKKGKQMEILGLIVRRI